MMRGPLGQVIGVVVFITAAVLLTSVVGVVASPITFVVLFFAVTTHPSVPFIVTGTLVGGLTALEGGWLFGYYVFGQFSGWTAVTMTLGGLVGVAVLLVAGLIARRAFLAEHVDIADRNGSTPITTPVA
jgi:hypothetical protein